MTAEVKYIQDEESDDITPTAVNTNGTWLGIKRVIFVSRDIDGSYSGYRYTVRYENGTFGYLYLNKEGWFAECIQQ